MKITAKQANILFIVFVMIMIGLLVYLIKKLIDNRRIAQDLEAQLQ